MLISVLGTAKNRLEPRQEFIGNTLVLSHCSLLINPWPKRPVSWSIVVKEKPVFDSLFFEAFPSDHISKATKNFSMHFFIHSSNNIKLYSRIPIIYTKEFLELFEASAYCILTSYTYFASVSFCMYTQEQNTHVSPTHIPTARLLFSSAQWTQFSPVDLFVYPDDGGRIPVRLCKCAIPGRIKTACKYTFANWEYIKLCKITSK
jgi:hypothetical protein